MLTHINSSNAIYPQILNIVHARLLYGNEEMNFFTWSSHEYRDSSRGKIQFPPAPDAGWVDVYPLLPSPLRRHPMLSPLSELATPGAREPMKRSWRESKCWALRCTRTKLSGQTEKPFQLADSPAVESRSPPS